MKIREKLVRMEGTLVKIGDTLVKIGGTCMIQLASRVTCVASASHDPDLCAVSASWPLKRLG